AVSLTARSTGDVNLQVNAQTYGAATVAVGDAFLRFAPVQAVNVDGGASINAAGDVNISAGRSANSNPVTSADQWTVASHWDGFAGSVIPISSVNAESELLLNNDITVA